jgi:hypothetical protein
VKEEDKYKEIPDIGVELVYSTVIKLKEEEEAKERIMKAKENDENNYKRIVEIINYLNVQLDNDKFRDKVTTDLNLKSIISELRAKLCNLDDI